MKDEKDGRLTGIRAAEKYENTCVILAN